jgi:hypothetical protein
MEDVKLLVHVNLVDDSAREFAEHVNVPRGTPKWIAEGARLVLQARMAQPEDVPYAGRVVITVRDAAKMFKAVRRLPAGKPVPLALFKKLEADLETSRERAARLERERDVQ